MDEQIRNYNYLNGAGVHDNDPAHGRVGIKFEHRQIIIKRSEKQKQESFRLGNWNVGTFRGRCGEVVKTLNRRKIDVDCVQGVRWREASTRTRTGNNNQYKLFWIGNNTGCGGIRIFVKQKWIKKGT